MSNQADYQYDVFISYRSSDRAWVEASLLKRLEGAELKYCIDFQNFVLGKPTIQNITNAVINSRKTLLILNQSYLESGWTEFERLLLQTLNPANNQEQLIPLMKEKCELPLEIKFLTYLDFSNLEDEQMDWQRLLTALGKPEVNRAFACPYDYEAQKEERKYLNSSLEQYSMGDRIGKGTAANIYKAIEKSTGRSVSIKVLRSENKELATEFEASVKRAISISDEPHFLTIYEMNFGGEYCYYVRQFIDGKSLRDFIEEWNREHAQKAYQGLPIDTSLKIILEIGEALEQAHKRISQDSTLKYYIYTDIKPSNVLLSNANVNYYRGRPEISPDISAFISSFNICDNFGKYKDEVKQVLNQFQKKISDFDTTILQEELFYMLPDFYANRDPISYEKADQYMLGLLAYEIITGITPRTLPIKERDDDLKSILQEIERRRFDVFESVGDIPRNDCPDTLKDVILKMMSREPDARYKRFSDAISALKGIDINLTLVRESYIRCLTSKSRNFSDEFFDVFLKKLEHHEPNVRRRLDFKNPREKARHADSFKQSILFLFAYFDQNERFYKYMDQKEDPNILSGIAKSHHETHKIPKIYYEPFGKALIDTVAEFDDKFDDFDMLREGWQDVYNLAAEYMKSKVKSRS